MRNSNEFTIVPILVADAWSKQVRHPMSEVFDTKFGPIHVWGSPMSFGGRVKALVGVLESQTSIRLLHENYTKDRVFRLCISRKLMRTLKPVYRNGYTSYFDEADVERLCAEHKHRCRECALGVDEWDDQWLSCHRVERWDADLEPIYYPFCSETCRKESWRKVVKEESKQRRHKERELGWLRIGESRMREIRRMLRPRRDQQKLQPTESRQATTSQT